MSANTRASRYVKKRQEQGHKRISLWIPEKDEEIIRAFAKGLMDKSETDTENDS